MIENPMFIETHRLAEFNPRGTDVPVVLDLMIHDIDAILSVVNSKVKAVHASGVSVISETPDIANARIEFENGCVANLTASRISLKNMRKSRFFQKDAYISVDFLEKKYKGMATIAANLDRMVSKGTITEEDKFKTISNIITYTDIKDGVVGVDLVVEAATENVELKLNIFKQLNEVCSHNTILATNTSSISITQIGAVVAHPERVIGMHFMNPVPIMKLVEIIRGYNTSDEVTKTIMALSKKLGKTPVEVNDYPGFCRQQNFDAND
eukprot:g33023.t1